MLPLLLAAALAHDVVVFGDSWAEGSADELGKVLKAHGRADLTVDGRGVGGTTAFYWNDSDPDALSAAVTANPDARWVWLSILGNDTFAHHVARAGGQAATKNEAELREMLDRLFAVHPDIQVLMFGYDYPNFEQSADCLAAAIVYFPALWDAGTLWTANVNDIFLRDIDAVQHKVAADYPNVEHVRVWGTLQLDAGTQGAPTSALPSPASRMSDCIHPTSAGYTALHERAWELYWGLPAPTVQVTADTRVCRTDRVRATGQASPATVRRWTVDGVDAGDGASLDLDLPAGSHTLTLQARNGAWVTEDTATVQVVEPPVATAIAERVRTCAGGSVSIGVTGEGEVTWSPSEGLAAPTGATTVASPAATTTYTATVAAAPGCADTATVEVEIVPLPEAGLTGPDALVQGVPGTFQVSAPADAEVTWQAPGAELTRADRTLEAEWSQAGPVTVSALVTLAGCSTRLDWSGIVRAAEGPGTSGVSACGCDAAAPSSSLSLLGLAGLLAVRRRRAR